MMLFAVDMVFLDVVMVRLTLAGPRQPSRPSPLLCSLSIASTIVIHCWPGFAEFHFQTSKIFLCFTQGLQSHSVSEGQQLIGAFLVSVDSSNLVLYATRSASRICQGMSWQHLHHPCVAGKV